jgi:hypothetical protein
MRSSTRWGVNAMVLAIAALTLTGTGALSWVARSGEISTIACYVSLAYDLTPLIDATLPDSTIASPECGALTEHVHSQNRSIDADPSNSDNRKAVATVDRPASANATNRASGSTAAPKP